MSYAIIGLGNIGTAIAQAFARQGIEVAVAGRRPVDTLAAQIGPSLIPQRVEDAVKADVVVLAMPFAAHREIARAAESWQGKIVIDATNAFGIPPEDLGPEHLENLDAERLQRQAVQRLEHLGFEVTLTPKREVAWLLRLK